MNTNTIIGIVVAVVVVLGAGYFLMSPKKSMPGQTNDATMPAGDTTSSGSPAANAAAKKPGTTATFTGGKFDGSVEDLVAKGGQWRCSVDTKTDKTVTAGVVYIADGKFRGNFTTVISGFGEVMSYMISDGSMSYSWSTATAMGVKAPIKKGTLPAANTQTSGSEFNALNSYSYFCEPWSVDITLFVPPKNITFMEAH